METKRFLVPRNDNGVAARYSGTLRRIRAGTRRSAPGQAIIEFCLMLPLILLIALATVDAGRFVFDYIGVRNAAIEGAIYGSLNPRDMPGAEQRVREHFTPAATAAVLSVSRAAAANCFVVGADGYVTVTASRVFTPLSLSALQALGPGGGWVLTVSSTAKARCMT